MIEEFGHVAFKVKDMKASQDFYIEKMGFRKCFEIKRKPDGSMPTAEDVVENSGTCDRDKVWIVYIQVSETQFIELFTLEPNEKEVEPKFDQTGYFHLAMVVDDIHAYRDELVGRGIVLDEEPKYGMDGTWQMWLHDPDGNKFEVMQYTENSAQLRFARK